MAGATKNHDYHILPPDAVPIVSAFSALLMAVGGADYTPRLERLERLWAHLGTGLPEAVTLAGCRIIPLDGILLIVRETRGVQGPLALAERPQIWDGRFVARHHGHLGGEVTVDRLRPGAMAVLRTALPDSALRRVPAAARPALPAVYDRDGLLAVPAFGFRRDGAQAPDVTLDFLPRHHLPAAAFPR